MKEGTIGGGFVHIAWIACFNSSGSFVHKQKQKDYRHELPLLLPHTVRRVTGVTSRNFYFGM
jgi:hypothetical protein